MLSLKAHDFRIDELVSDWHEITERFDQKNRTFLRSESFASSEADRCFQRNM